MRCHTLLLSWLLVACLQDAFVDEVGFGAVTQSGEDFVHLLTGTESIVMDSLAFPASAFPGTATTGFLLFSRFSDFPVQSSLGLHYKGTTFI